MNKLHHFKCYMAHLYWASVALIQFKTTNTFNKLHHFKCCMYKFSWACYARPHKINNNKSIDQIAPFQVLCVKCVRLATLALVQSIAISVM
jgi:hypothetical protein